MTGTMMIETRASRVFSDDGGKVDNKNGDNSGHADCLVADKTAQGIHVRGSASEQIAGFYFRVIGERQPRWIRDRTCRAGGGCCFSAVWAANWLLRKLEVACTRIRPTKPAAERSSSLPETAFLEDVIHKPAKEEVYTRSGCGGDCQHRGGEQVMPVITAHWRHRAVNPFCWPRPHSGQEVRVFRIMFLHLNNPRTAINNYLEIQTKNEHTRARGERQLTLQKMAIGDVKYVVLAGSGGFCAGKAAP